MSLLPCADSRSDEFESGRRQSATVVPIEFERPEFNDQQAKGNGRGRVEFELATLEEAASDRDVNINVRGDGDGCSVDSAGAPLASAHPGRVPLPGGREQAGGPSALHPIRNRGSVLKTAAAGRSTPIVCAFMQFLLMTDADFEQGDECADGRAGGRSSAAAGPASNRQPRTKPTAYHFQQFHMALQYWQKWHPNVPADKADGEFLRFMSEHASDWIPVTPAFLQRSFSKAVLYYTLLMLTLPVWVLLSLHDDRSAHGRCVAHLLQVWSGVLMRRTWPLSSIHRLVAHTGVRIASAALLCALYASVVMCVFLRFPGGFMPTVHENEPSSDAFFPLVFAVLTGLLIGIQAAATLDFTVVSAVQEPSAEHRRAVRASMAAVAHPHSAKENLSEELIKWIYEVPTEKVQEQSELEESRSVLQQRHPLASSWLRSPAPILLSMFAEVQHPDYRWQSRSSLCFMLLSILVTLYPNLVSLAAGGAFLGSCDPYRRKGGCVFGNGGVQFGAVLRIVLMLGQTYLVAFLLHINYNYFAQKTIVRSKLFAILRRLLVVEETVQMQRHAQQNATAQQQHQLQRRGRGRRVRWLDVAVAAHR